MMTVWDLYFAAVCSIRFHPANANAVSMRPEEVEVQIAFALMIVDQMMEARKCQLSQQ